MGYYKSTDKDTEVGAGTLRYDEAAVDRLNFWKFRNSTDTKTLVTSSLPFGRVTQNIDVATWTNSLWATPNYYKVNVNTTLSGTKVITDDVVVYIPYGVVVDCVTEFFDVQTSNATIMFTGGGTIRFSDTLRTNAFVRDTLGGTGNRVIFDNILFELPNPGIPTTVDESFLTHNIDHVEIRNCEVTGDWRAANNEPFFRLKSTESLVDNLYWNLGTPEGETRFFVDAGRISNLYINDNTQPIVSTVGTLSKPIIIEGINQGSEVVVLIDKSNVTVRDVNASTVTLDAFSANVSRVVFDNVSASGTFALTEATNEISQVSIKNCSASILQVNGKSTGAGRELKVLNTQITTLSSLNGTVQIPPRTAFVACEIGVISSGTTNPFKNGSNNVSVQNCTIRDGVIDAITILGDNLNWQSNKTGYTVTFDGDRQLVVGNHINSAGGSVILGSSSTNCLATANRVKAAVVDNGTGNTTADNPII